MSNVSCTCKLLMTVMLWAFPFSSAGDSGMSQIYSWVPWIVTGQLAMIAQWLTTAGHAAAGERGGACNLARSEDTRGAPALALDQHSNHHASASEKECLMPRRWSSCCSALGLVPKKRCLTTSIPLRACVNAITSRQQASALQIARQRS